MAALCHDIGHLPFSHAAEKELLPEGWSHERLTMELVRSSDLAGIWKEIKLQPEDVVKLAVGPEEYREGPFSDLEAILSEIIVGNAFGVDRMDYLLRDSHHSGVAYGKFDHYRLIDTMRILPKPAGNLPDSAGRASESTLGILEGGLHSAEALLWARYFMFTQLYFHPIRRVYDIHLKTFLKEWLPGGAFSTDLEKHLQMTDNEVMAALLLAARQPDLPGHVPARRLVNRDHFRILYERNPDDVKMNPEAAKAVSEEASCRYNGTNVYYDSYRETSRAIDFPVLTRDGRIVFLPCSFRYP
jgi:HD superfamily phosphohydrolase